MGLINFVKTIWNNGGPPGVSAHQLNRIENGIKALDDLTTATAQPNKILALNSQSKLPADITGDAVTLNGKQASDFLIGESQNGFFSETASVAGHAFHTKTVPLNKSTYRRVICSFTDTLRGGIVLGGTNPLQAASIIIAGSNGEFSSARSFSSALSPNSVNNVNYVISGINTIALMDVYIDGSNLIIKWGNKASTAQNLNINVAWQVLEA